MNETHVTEHLQSDNDSTLGPDLLWHTGDINLLSTDSEHTRHSASNVCVAIIDTGCDAQHPCLRSSDIEEIDFAAFEYGGHYNDMGNMPDLRSAINQSLSIDISKYTSSEGIFVHKIISAIESRKPEQCCHDIENPAHRYGYHGTACAGLIAADKPVESTRTPVYQQVKDLGFRGVVPGCKLLSISTPFNDDVKPIIRALLFCVARDVDTILIPRSVSQRSGAKEARQETGITRDDANAAFGLVDGVGI